MSYSRPRGRRAPHRIVDRQGRGRRTRPTDREGTRIRSRRLRRIRIGRRHRHGGRRHIAVASLPWQAHLEVNGALELCPTSSVAIA